MKIKVTKTTKAASCPLGIHSKEYKAGETYEIFDSLAKVFISEGWGAEEGAVVAKAAKVVLEDKAVKSAEENKEVVVEKEEKKEDKPQTVFSRSSFNKKKRK
jgi:hypothetical protein